MQRMIGLLFCIIGCCSYVITSAQDKHDTPRPRLNHLAIFVVDVQKSASFYSDLFAFDTLPEPFHDNKHAWFSIGPGIALHIIQGAPQPKAYFLNNHMCFSVQSTATYIEKLIKKGVSYYNAQGEKSRITTRIDGVKQVWIQDPDGYYIEINDARQ